MEGIDDDAFLTAAGFEVVRPDGDAGGRNFFLTPRPRRRLRKKADVTDYLEEQHGKGQMPEVTEDMFTFGKRKRVPQEVAAVPQVIEQQQQVMAAENSGAGRCKVDEMAALLTRDPNKKLEGDHGSGQQARLLVRRAGVAQDGDVRL
jgi:hypothetical protein